jgi:hypothetical protein
MGRSFRAEYRYLWSRRGHRWLLQALDQHHRRFLHNLRAPPPVGARSRVTGIHSSPRRCARCLGAASSLSVPVMVEQKQRVVADPFEPASPESDVSGRSNRRLVPDFGHYSPPRRNRISACWKSRGFSMCGICPQSGTTTSVPCGISFAAARPSSTKSPIFARASVEA